MIKQASFKSFVAENLDLVLVSALVIIGILAFDVVRMWPALLLPTTMLGMHFYYFKKETHTQAELNAAFAQRWEKHRERGFMWYVFVKGAFIYGAYIGIWILMIFSQPVAESYGLKLNYLLRALYSYAAGIPVGIILSTILWFVRQARADRYLHNATYQQ